MSYISELSMIAAALSNGRPPIHWLKSPGTDLDNREEAFRQWQARLIELAENYEAMDEDPILEAIRAARIQRDEAERALKVLVAYARTCNRPYSLREIAERARLSPSTVADYYGVDEIEEARAIVEEATRMIRIDNEDTK